MLAPEQVTRVLAPFTGRGRDFGDVQQALEALTAAYQAAGYGLVAVTLPEQELARGVVRLDVAQTRIGQVQVRGERYVDSANVRRALPPLRADLNIKLMAFMSAYFDLKAGIVAVDLSWLSGKANRHAARLFVQALVANDDSLFEYLRLSECAAQRPALSAHLEHIQEVPTETKLDRQQTWLITVVK